MFDVAAGECKLVDFLLTRFDPVDLKSKIKVDPTGRVFEQMVSQPVAPMPPFNTGPAQPLAPAHVIEVPFVPTPDPVPEPVLAAADGQDGYVETPLEVADDTDVATLGEAPVADAVAGGMAPPPPGTSPEDLLKLIQSFHAAAERYKWEGDGDENAT